MLEKKNQAFVVGHRNGLLLFSCEKLLDYFCQEISKYEVGSIVSKKLFDVLELMFRLTMNASHSNGKSTLRSKSLDNQKNQRKRFSFSKSLDTPIFSNFLTYFFQI
jgi:hypothetical protein